MTKLRVLVLLISRGDSQTKAELLFDIISFGNNKHVITADDPRLKLVFRYLVKMSAIMPLEI